MKILRNQKIKISDVIVRIVDQSQINLLRKAYYLFYKQFTAVIPYLIYSLSYFTNY